MSSAIASVAVAAVGVGLAANSAKDARKAGSKASDNAIQAEAAAEGVAQQQLDFAKEQDARANIRADAADALTKQVTDKQLQSMDQNMALAADYDAYNKGTFRPLEKGIVADAEAYDTPARREAAAGAAGAAVQQSLTQAHDADNRTLTRMGVNPNSGRALVTQNETSIAGALAGAGAENNARTQVETLGAAKKMDAASLGRNLPSSQATSAGLGIQAGTAAVNGTATTNNSAINGIHSVGGLYSNASQTYGNATRGLQNLAMNTAALSADANAGLAKSFGGLGGAGIAAFKDITPKFGTTGSTY